jgi:hypothetical protein
MFETDDSVESASPADVATTLRSSYGTTGGTVQITSSTDSELEGIFNFSAFGPTVEGSFTAERTDEANRVVCAPDCEDA